MPPDRRFRRPVVSEAAQGKQPGDGLSAASLSPARQAARGTPHRDDREIARRTATPPRLLATPQPPSQHPAWLWTRLLGKAAVWRRLVPNRNLARGTAWASDIVNYLREHGWVHAERRALNGAQDGGDIAGVIDVCIEAKNEKRVELAQYLKETEAEKTNAGATVAACWIGVSGAPARQDGWESGLGAGRPCNCDSFRASGHVAVR